MQLLLLGSWTSSSSIPVLFFSQKLCKTKQAYIIVGTVITSNSTFFVRTAHMALRWPKAYLTGFLAALRRLLTITFFICVTSITFLQAIRVCKVPNQVIWDFLIARNHSLVCYRQFAISQEHLIVYLTTWTKRSYGRKASSKALQSHRYWEYCGQYIF